jgi:hypothetical protein
MIKFFTKKIDRIVYTDIINRLILFNSSDGTRLTGYNIWRNFNENYNLNIISITDQGEFEIYYTPNTLAKAWGVSYKKNIYIFIKDSNNPTTFRNNLMVLANELLRPLFQDRNGAEKYKKKFDIVNSKINLPSLLFGINNSKEYEESQ